MAALRQKLESLPIVLREPCACERTLEMRQRWLKVSKGVALTSCRVFQAPAWAHESPSVGVLIRGRRRQSCVLGTWCNNAM